MLEPYARLRPSNVFGTQRDLPFATRHTVKPVHYVSTINTLTAGVLSDYQVFEVPSPTPPASLPEDTSSQNGRPNAWPATHWPGGSL